MQQPSSPLPISATILVKNAKDTIKECLQSLQDFDEVILLDNGSSDGTLNIAANFSNVKIYTSEFIGFGKLKNLAINYARNDWIFSIDSDEVLESAALELIRALPPFRAQSATTESTLDSNPADSNPAPAQKPQDSQNLHKHIYALPRKNLYNGQWIKACGWYPDYVWRLFNKNFTRFNENIVHESVIIPQDSITHKLPSGLKHYATPNIESMMNKMNRYTSYSAKERFKAHKKASMSGALARFFLTFIKDYCLRGGIKYGYKGFFIALCNALGAFFRYAKLYELYKQEQEAKKQ